MKDSMNTVERLSKLESVIKDIIISCLSNSRSFPSSAYLVLKMI